MSCQGKPAFPPIYRLVAAVDRTLVHGTYERHVDLSAVLFIGIGKRNHRFYCVLSDNRQKGGSRNSELIQEFEDPTPVISNRAPPESLSTIDIAQS